MLRTTIALLNNLLRLPFLPLWLLARGLRRPKGSWVLVRLRSRIVELPRPLEPWLRFWPPASRRLPTPLSLLRELAEEVAEDDRIEGVAFVMPPLQVGWARARALREILETLRASGKKVAVHLPQGGGNKEAYVASAADRVLLSREAGLMTLGLAAESRYLKPLLDRLGLEVEAFARKEYKTAAESLTRDGMSRAQREQLTALLGGFDEELRGALAQRPRVDAAAVESIFERGIHRGEEGIQMGLYDGLAYEDELPLGVDPERQGPVKWVRAPAYLSYRRARPLRRLRPPPHIAVVEVRGAISGGGDRPGSQEKAVAALRSARADERALGVVLHIDSPGGSALASDLIHREVVRLKEKKPVVACFGDVAASGGYYIAAPADVIVAQPTTLTGSIGVVSARFMAKDLLDKVGIRTEVIRTAPHADLFSPSRALEESERDLIERELDAFYGSFVNIVAEGRGRTSEEVEPLCRGRVWSGRAALEHGLIDRLGGLDVALDEIRSRLDLSPKAAARLRPRRVAPRKLHLPPPEPLEQGAMALLRGVPPEAAELLHLLAMEPGVLFYAAELPRLR